MRAHQDHADVHEKTDEVATGLLCGPGGSLAATEAVRLGALADLQAALRAHRGRAGVQAQASMVAMILCASSEGAKEEAMRLRLPGQLLIDVQLATLPHWENSMGHRGQICMMMAGRMDGWEAGRIDERDSERGRGLWETLV